MPRTRNTSRVTTGSNDTHLTSMNLRLNESSSVHMCSTLLNVEDIKVFKDMNGCQIMQAGSEESSKSISTPIYSSDTSTYEDGHESCEFGDDEFGPTKMRFIVIGVASIAFFFQIFSQTIWSAIYEPALLAFPKWTSKSLSLLPIWGSVMTAALVFPTCMLINKYGLKVSLLCSCGFLTLGTAVRCLPYVYSSTLCINLSAVFISASGVFMTPLMITISAQWFPKNERNMATGFCSAMGMLGSAATYIIGPIVVSTASGEPQESDAMRRQIMELLYVCFGISVSVTVLVLLAFPKHTRPVSYPSKLSMASHRSAKLLHSLRVLVKNSEVWYLVLAFALSNTMSAPWSALLPSTFSKLHVPPDLGAECCLFLIIHNFFLSLSISTFADRAPGYSKELALCSRLVSLVFLFWLMLMMNFHAKLTTTTLACVILMAFPYCWCSQSLLYEMGAELMVPLPESFVAGYMTLINNLLVDCTYVVLYLFPSFGDYWLHIGVFVFSVLSIIFLLLSMGLSKKNVMKTKHRRM